MKAILKKLIMAAALVAVMAGVITGCGSKKNDSNVAKNSGDTFTVGFDAEFPPYGYKDDSGEYVGFDLDLAAEVCSRNGWTLVKQPIEWESKDMELNSGMIDCIWNGFTMDGREKEYTWSTAYVDNSQVVVVKKNSGITKLSDLAGKNVIVQSDSSALAAFTGEDADEENIRLAASFKSLQQVGDYNSAFLNLDAGSADAVCMDIGVAKYEVESRGDTFTILNEHVSSEEYGVGFKKGNTQLRNQVQETLEEMLADGSFDSIVQKWGLEESACLGQPGTDSVMKAEDTVKEKPGFLDNMLGLVITFIRRSKLKILNWVARIYISIMRGTPLMLQLLVVFFGPYYLFGMSLSNSYRFYAVIIGFSLNYAAYFAEIYRSGIEAVPKGQYEAAAVLGYSRTQTFVRIIFPQMVKIVLPPVTNEVITLVKDTSLAFALAYTEMFTLAKQIAAAQTSIMPLFVAGLFYYIFNFVVAYGMEKLENKMKY